MLETYRILSFVQGWGHYL